MPDDPVGRRARARCLLERVQLGGRRRPAKASRIACGVIEESQSRRTGSVEPAFS